MSLINDMLNDLEQNKDKNNRTKTVNLDQRSSGVNPEGTPDIQNMPDSTGSTPPTMPPADEVKLTMDEPTNSHKEDKTEPVKISIPEEEPKKESQDYQQPWETGQAAQSPEPTATTNSPTLNADIKVIDSKKSSQKRLIIWVVIIGAACAALAFLYFWPNNSKPANTTHTPMAVPSAPQTPTIDIQKDNAKTEVTAAINNTPADKAAEDSISKENKATTEDKPAAPETGEADLTTNKTTDAQTNNSDAIALQPVELSPEAQAQNSYDQIMSNMSTLSAYQAIEQMQELLKEHPAFKSARTALAAMLIKYNNSAQALIVLEKGLKQTPSDKQMAELTAHILVENHQIKRALTILKKAQPATLQAAPDFYALMAGLYLQEKDYLEAQNFYQALTNLNPENGTWWAGLAISSEKLGQNQASMNAYNKAETIGGLSPALQAYIDQTMQGS